jgi:cytochrome d ubiquinol oxidase subunit I
MDGLDGIELARIQFAANMTFHILFPTISISLGWVLLFFKLRFVKTGQHGLRSPGAGSI